MLVFFGLLSSVIAGSLFGLITIVNNQGDTPVGMQVNYRSVWIMLGLAAVCFSLRAIGWNPVFLE